MHVSSCDGGAATWVDVGFFPTRKPGGDGVVRATAERTHTCRAYARAHAWVHLGTSREPTAAVHCRVSEAPRGLPLITGGGGTLCFSTLLPSASEEILPFFEKYTRHTLAPIGPPYMSKIERSRFRKSI